MNGKYGIALFGLGRMGQIHVVNLIKNPKIKLLYIVELDLALATKVKTDLFLETTIIHLRESSQVFEDINVNGVVICTPTDTHDEIVTRALQAGKGVLCEKPISTSLEVTRRCYDEAKKRDLPLLCAFNRRFDPQVAKVKANVSLIGKIHTIKTCSRDSPRPPNSYLKISGGIFHDCAVHDIDVIRWFVGEEPSTVYVAAHCHDAEIAQMDDVDTVFILMKFPSGVIAHIDLARDCSYGYHQTIELFGEKGSLESGNPKQDATIFSNKDSAHHEILHYSFKQRYADAYGCEIDHFLELLSDKNIICKIQAEDTLQAARIAQACEDSWRSGSVIHLPKKQGSI